MIAVLLAQMNQWAYIGWSYAIVIGVLVAFATWTILRGRRVGRRLPDEERRWM